MTARDSISRESAPAPEDRTQAIRDHLRDAIVDRRLAPGTKLAESEVGALFDVSRTVARAALQMLSFEGLVYFERNRGAFVCNPTPAEARQLFAARRLIEPGLAAAVTEHATAEDFARLHAHLVEEQRHLSARGPNARRAEIKASGEFHLLLAAISGNSILQRFMEELIARSSLVIALYGRTGTSSCGLDEHRQIVHLLEKGDIKSAESMIIRHIDHIEIDLDLDVRTGPALREALQL